MMNVRKQDYINTLFPNIFVLKDFYLGLRLENERKSDLCSALIMYGGLPEVVNLVTGKGNLTPFN